MPVRVSGCERRQRGIIEATPSDGGQLGEERGRSVLEQDVELLMETQGDIKYYIK